MDTTEQLTLIEAFYICLLAELLPASSSTNCHGGTQPGKANLGVSKSSQKGQALTCEKEISFDTSFNVDELLEDVILNAISLSQKTA